MLWALPGCCAGAVPRWACWGPGGPWGARGPLLPLVGCCRALGGLLLGPIPQLWGTRQGWGSAVWATGVLWSARFYLGCDINIRRASKYFSANVCSRRFLARPGFPAIAGPWVLLGMVVLHWRSLEVPGGPALSRCNSWLDLKPSGVLQRWLPSAGGRLVYLWDSPWGRGWGAQVGQLGLGLPRLPS